MDIEFTMKPTKRHPYSSTWAPDADRLTYQEGLWVISYDQYEGKETWRARRESPRATKHIRAKNNRRTFVQSCIKYDDLALMRCREVSWGWIGATISIVWDDSFHVFRMHGIKEVIDYPQKGGILAIRASRKDNSSLLSSEREEWAKRFVKVAGQEYVDDIESDLFFILAGSSREPGTSRFVDIFFHRDQW